LWANYYPLGLANNLEITQYDPHHKPAREAIPLRIRIPPLTIPFTLDHWGELLAAVLIIPKMVKGIVQPAQMKKIAATKNEEAR
jgi:hypothetical protein